MVCVLKSVQHVEYVVVVAAALRPLNTWRNQREGERRRREQEEEEDDEIVFR